MRISFVAAVAVLLLCATTQVTATTGGGHFAQEGFPTMGLFAGVTFVALGIFFGIAHGGADLRGSNSSLGVGFLALNAVNALFGIFLLFGPGQTAFGAARVNVLGLQLMVGAGLGFYAAYTNLKAVAQALFVLLLATALALAGSLPWFQHTSAVWQVDNASCISYFGSSDPDFNRCDEKGYLQFVRVVGLTALFFLMGQIAQIFVALSEGGPLMHGGAKIGGDDNRAPLMGGGFGEQQQPQQHAVYAPQEHQQVQQQQPQVAQPYAGPAPSEGAKGAPAYQAL